MILKSISNCFYYCAKLLFFGQCYVPMIAIMNDMRTICVRVLCELLCKDYLADCVAPTVAPTLGCVTIGTAILPKGVEDEIPLKACNILITILLMEEMEACMVTRVFSAVVILAWKHGKLVAFKLLAISASLEEF
ncbi:hypothetical protein Tco_1063289 [Tanacetum coccineum]